MFLKSLLVFTIYKNFLQIILFLLQPQERKLLYWIMPNDSNLRTIALIVSYCSRKFTCHVIHRARTLITKMNNDRADGHCYIALLGFNDFWRSVTPSFLFRNGFCLQLSQPYLAETISLQSSECNILGLAATVAFFADEARLTQI